MSQASDPEPIHFGAGSSGMEETQAITDRSRLPQPGARSLGDLSEGAGATIGRYQLLHSIGEGGFGTVFLAEQREPVQRKVALKILKLGMDTRQVIARFEQERQSLALMDHSHIAKVLDAGATDTGRPYFVMELVSGRPITTFADGRKLDIAERLGLFLQVCNAVQHAHQKGIIHRDIKPSNVLVGLQDEEPQVKVIDFGIAKAVASDQPGRTLVTAQQQWIGTPDYMSPEQAQGSVDIDTRTDVYSLGVLLYELLTGDTPLDSDSLRRASPGELERIIRDVEPPRPSTRLFARPGKTDTSRHQPLEPAATKPHPSSEVAGAHLASLAAQRSTPPTTLLRQLRGDLDWIVMKAIEKDRARRYQTASELAADIQRHLSGEPVVAAPPSAGYRVRKFIRRNKGSVLAAGFVAAALLLGVVGTSWGWWWALQERDRATQEAARATAMNSFMEQILLATNPNTKGDRNVTVLEVLANASEHADKTLRDQPQVETSARTFLGATFASLGRLDEAEKELRRALEICEGGSEKNTLRHAEILYQLAKLNGDRHQLDTSLRLHQQAMDVLTALAPKYEFERTTQAIALGSSLMKSGRYPEAEEQLDRAAALLGDSDNLMLRTNLLNVRAGLAESWKGDLAQAEKLHEQRIELLRRSDRPAQLASSLNGLAVIKMHRGDLDGALPLYEECLLLERQQYGDVHQNLAEVLENLGNLYYRRKDYAKSAAIMEEVVAMRIKIFGADGFPVARSRFNIAALYLANGETEKAMNAYNEALPKFRQALGDANPEVAVVLRSRGELLKIKGDLDGARRDLREALAIFEATVKPTEPRRLKTVMLLLEVFCKRGEQSKASSLFAKTMSSLDSEKPEHAKTVEMLEVAMKECRQETPPSAAPGDAAPPASP